MKLANKIISADEAVAGDSPYAAAEQPDDPGGGSFPWWVVGVAVVIVAVAALAPLPGRRRRSRAEPGD